MIYKCLKLVSLNLQFALFMVFPFASKKCLFLFMQPYPYLHIRNKEFPWGMIFIIIVHLSCFLFLLYVTVPKYRKHSCRLFCLIIEQEVSLFPLFVMSLYAGRFQQYSYCFWSYLGFLFFHVIYGILTSTWFLYFE